MPRWLIGPNRLHYWWIADWKRAFPAASVYIAPGVEEQAGEPCLHTTFDQTEEEISASRDVRIRELREAGFDI